jgi:hypothetical protein
MKKRERESGDGWVKEKGLRPTRGAAPQWPSLQVNHGGVSKRAHWANLHRALRGRGEGLGGPCCQPK